MSYNRIAIIMAMQAEANPIIKGLGMEKEQLLHSKLPMVEYTAKVGESDVHLVVNGVIDRYGIDCIGTEAAILNAHLTIDRFKPNVLISAGTAGGFKASQASIGDVYLSHKMFCFHDRRIPIPGFDEYGIGRFDCMDTTPIAKELNLKQGIVSTGSSLDCTPKDLEVMQSYNAEVKEMEAAAIAWVAQLHGVPFFAVKSITDLVDTPHPTEEEFLKNLHRASDILANKTIEVIRYLSGCNSN